MRILIVNWSIRRVAGTEEYLDNIIPELFKHGHEVAFAHEVDLPAARERISLPPGTPTWDMSVLGRKHTLERMRSWKPELIYAHGLLNTKFESGFLDIAPALYFAHNYYGTCISGLKTFQFPIVQPCSRRFGSACLLHYFPRRCGGRNPLTMFRLFFRESKRLANFSRYKGIITHSSHMREEYLRQGLPQDRVHSFLHEISPWPESARTVNTQMASQATRSREATWRLLFVGRMELLKGGTTLIDALPLAAAALNHPIHLVLAGDGPDRGKWERHASRIRERHPAVSFEFAGWVGRESLETHYAETDLLVVPSLWPEPFGRIGPEAGLRSVPVAAFAVGGIPDWLLDGVNGFLAPGDPPTVVGLAEAIAKCLSDPVLYQQLRLRASQVAERFNMENHYDALSKAIS